MPITVDVLQNIRDVAGLPLLRGGKLPPGILYRSDAPLAGDASPDVPIWPPRTVVDLRSVGEGATPHPLDSGDTQVFHLPMMKDANPLRIAQTESAHIASLRSMYLTMLRDSASTIVRAIEVIARGPAPVLVHCAAGKDRTGVIFAVVLAALGVPRDAIAADYHRTEHHMSGVLRRLGQDWSEAGIQEALDRLARERPELLTAPRPAIDSVLDEVERGPGGARGWLAERGLSPYDDGLLVRRFTASNGRIIQRGRLD
jgi:protein-tyrosine phosphatase